MIPIRARRTPLALGPAIALMAGIFAVPARADAPALAWKAETRSPHPAASGPEKEAALHALCGADDEALDEVAAREAAGLLVGSGSLAADELAFTLRAAGDPHLSPRGFSVRSAQLDEGDLAQRVKTWASHGSALGVRRCGVARAKTADGGTIVAAVAYDALADMAPLPTKARVAQWLTLEATMLVPATGAKVVLLGPRGAPKTILASLSGSVVKSSFSVDREGTWLVQVVATVASGPRPVLEAMVYAGTSPPSHFVREPAPGEDAAKGAKDDADAVLLMVNAARDAEGVGTLARDAALDKLAAAHSEEMRKTRMVAHDVGDGDPVARLHAAGLSMRLTGENVASSTTLASAHRALWASPSHRENLLFGQFTKIGVAAVKGADGALWVTEFFGG